MEIYQSINKRFLKDINTDIISNGNKYFVTNIKKWDGYIFYDCFEIASNLIDIINPKIRYIARELYIKDENTGDYNSIGFTVDEF